MGIRDVRLKLHDHTSFMLTGTLGPMMLPTVEAFCRIFCSNSFASAFFATTSASSSFFFATSSSAFSFAWTIERHAPTLQTALDATTCLLLSCDLLLDRVDLLADVVGLIIH